MVANGASIAREAIWEQPRICSRNGWIRSHCNHHGNRDGVVSAARGPVLRRLPEVRIAPRVCHGRADRYAILLLSSVPVSVGYTSERTEAYGRFVIDSPISGSAATPRACFQRVAALRSDHAPLSRPSSSEWRAIFLARGSAYALSRTCLLLPPDGAPARGVSLSGGGDRSVGRDATAVSPSIRCGGSQRGWLLSGRGRGACSGPGGPGWWRALSCSSGANGGGPSARA